MRLTKFFKIIWVTIKGPFLVSFALFPSYAIILENKLDALSIKLLIIRVNLATGRSSENLGS